MYQLKKFYKLLSYCDFVVHNQKIFEDLQQFEKIQTKISGFYASDEKRLTPANEVTGSLAMLRPAKISVTVPGGPFVVLGPIISPCSSFPGSPQHHPVHRPSVWCVGVRCAYGTAPP